MKYGIVNFLRARPIMYIVLYPQYLGACGWWVNPPSIFLIFHRLWRINMALYSKYFPRESLAALKVFLTLATGVLRIPFVEQKTQKLKTLHGNTSLLLAPRSWSYTLECTVLKIVLTRFSESRLLYVPDVYKLYYRITHSNMQNKFTFCRDSPICIE